MGYFGFILMANRAPTTKPADSAVITIDQDFAPLKCSSATSGPSTFSAAAQHITINENETTTITIQLKDLNTRQPSIKSLIMVFLLFAIGGVKWLNIETNIPAITKDAASAGILIDTYGAAITLGIDAASFIIAGVLVSTLSHLTPPMENNTNTMMKDFIDGWRVFKSFNWIVIVVVSFSFIVMCWAAAENVLGPLIALEHFNGAKSWSIVITAESAGLVVGALLAIKIKPKYPIRFLQISSFTLCFYMFALAKPQSLLVISICAFFFGITLDLWGTLWYTALHRKVPRDALSRVSSFDALGALIFKPIGLAIAAPISLLIGIDNLIYILIAISVLAISLPLLSSDVRNMSYEDSPNN